MLQRRDKGELDGFPLLVTCFRPGERVGDAELCVGVRLDPGRLDQRAAIPRARVRGRAVVNRQHASRSPLDHAQADVSRDRVQPRTQRAAPFELGQPAPCLDQRLLDRVLGIVNGAEHPIAVRMQQPSVWLDQLGVGALVPQPRRVQQDALARLIDLFVAAHRQLPLVGPRSGT
jgi:hypothetical protein